jgi:hypothetical protein
MVEAAVRPDVGLAVGTAENDAVGSEARLLLVSEDGEVPHEPHTPAESPGTTTATLELITAFPRMQVCRRRSVASQECCKYVSGAVRATA